MTRFVCLALALQLTASVLPAQEIELRVGVVAFEDFHDDFDQYAGLCRQLAHAAEPDFRPRLASGTYADVLHWLDRGSVDIAILTPGVFVQSMRGAVFKESDTSAPPEAHRYLATVGLPPATGDLARADRRQPGYHYQSRAVCLVPAHSAIHNAADLKRAWQAGQVHFLFVHPLSVAGRLAPQYALAQMGIKPERMEFEFTESHSNTVQLVASAVGAAPTTPVGFVWDDVQIGQQVRDKLRSVPIAELDGMWVPQAVVVACKGFPHADTVTARLLAHRDAQGQTDFIHHSDWRVRYGHVARWRDALDAPYLERDLQSVSLAQIGQTLLHAARSQPRPPRIALVLSGGGAKCSYQVGAVAAVEEEFARLRAEHPQTDVDLHLVVGTSGGAINTLPIALKVSASQEGREDFRQVWSELDQREIVRPSRLVRGNIGLWFALLQALAALWLVNRFVRRGEHRGWWFALIFTLLGGIQIALGYLNFSPWSFLGDSHVVHHAWLWGTFGVRASAWFLLGLGLLGLTVQSALGWRARHLELGRWTYWLLAAGLLGLPLVQIVTVLFHEQTLSTGEGIEHALADKFPRLIGRQLARDALAPLVLPTADASDREILAATSREVVQRRLVRRDMVLTGSCLAQTADELPSDLYFYLAADSSRGSPPFGSRGVSLREHPAILLDVVMGSGSIFPVFPSRTIRDFPRAGEQIELVDGGFAHNSPIEAAVLWGATHVISIEATPETRTQRRNFVENSAAAFEHLYDQAQLLDAHSRGQVTIFTLAPQPPHLCVLDFANNLVEQAVERGYRDAVGENPTGFGALRAPRFRKELGEPHFVDLE